MYILNNFQNVFNYREDQSQNSSVDLVPHYLIFMIHLNPYLI